MNYKRKNEKIRRKLKNIKKKIQHNNQQTKKWKIFFF